MKYWLIIWQKLPANGMALYPFILLRNKGMRTNQTLINHEKIHLVQQLELLVIPFYMLYVLHYAVNLVRYRNHQQAYFNIVFEQEAYRFDRNLDYLKTRRLFAWTTLL